MIALAEENRNGSLAGQMGAHEWGSLTFSFYRNRKLLVRRQRFFKAVFGRHSFSPAAPGEPGTE